MIKILFLAVVMFTTTMAGLTVQQKSDRNLSGNILRVDLNIGNEGSSDIDLQSYELDYFFSEDQPVAEYIYENYYSTSNYNIEIVDLDNTYGTSEKNANKIGTDDYYTSFEYTMLKYLTAPLRKKISDKMTAGKRIIFETGFKVEEGEKFNAKIDKSLAN